MAFITTDLTNGGRTTHYQIEYDDSLSQADGRDRANGLVAVCENDFNLMSGWFGGITLTVPTPITVQIGPGPYARASWGPPITLIPGNGSSLDLVRYLLVSEVTEMFMMAQNRGWFGNGNEGSAGEGLSRFLAAQILDVNGLGTGEPGFSLANYWMNSPSQDFVNNVDPNDHGLDPKTGCAILFIYYLHVQLGFSIESIIAVAAPNVAGVYRNLTGDTSDPFPFFKQLLDNAFPGTTTIPGDNPDNSFPLGLKLPTIVSRNLDQLDLFDIRFDGGVWTNWWNPNDSWWNNLSFADSWARAHIPGGPFNKKTSIAAVSRNPDQLDIFVIGNDGSVWTNWWNPNDSWWNNDRWHRIPHV